MPEIKASVRQLTIPVLLGGLVAICYAPILANEFLMFDDDINFYNNPHLGEITWSRLVWMFADDSYMPRYMPLGWLQLALVFEWAGLDAQAYHAVNYALHVCVAWLVYAVLLVACRLVVEKQGRPVDDLRLPWLAALGAAVWALHPLRVEPVAWATGVHYVHATAWAMVAAYLLLTRLALRGGARRVRVVAAWVSLAVATLVYPVTLGLPFALAAFEWWFRRGESKLGLKLARSHGVLFATALVAAAANVWSRMTVTSFFPPSPTIAEFGGWERLLQAATSATYYLWRPLVPGDPAPVHDALFGQPAFYAIGGSCMAVCAVWAFAAIATYRRCPGFLAWTLAYVASCGAYLGFLESPFQPSDRYTYFPSIIWVFGLAMLVVGNLQKRPTWVFGIGCCWAAWLALSAVPVLERWRDTEKHFAAIAKQVRNPAAAALYAGRTAVFQARQGQFALADRTLLEIELAGAWPAAMERIREEVMNLRQLAQSKTILPAPQEGVAPDALASHQMALHAMRREEFRTTAVRFEWALAIEPGFLDARYNYASWLALQGRLAEAREQADRLAFLSGRPELHARMEKLKALLRPTAIEEPAMSDGDAL